MDRRLACTFADLGAGVADMSWSVLAMEDDPFSAW
jgi:hypothetical protein